MRDLTSKFYSETEHITTPFTAIALLDVLFIVACVPESLPTRPKNWGAPITWEQADPFSVCFIFLILLRFSCSSRAFTFLLVK